MLEPSFSSSSSITTTNNELSLESITKHREELITNLPKWLVDYVKWHAEAKESLYQYYNNNKNDKNNDIIAPPRLLILSIEGSPSGGLADRLRSLPFFVWEAARTQRIFLMEWKNPCPLEEFFVPPIGGIDWTVPAQIINKYYTEKENTVWYSYDNNEQLAENHHKFQDVPIIKVLRPEWVFTKGMPLMAKEALNVTSMFDPMISHIYKKLLLTPSPPVQKLMDSTMQSLQLIPKQYNGIHLRARYPGFLPEKAKKKKYLFFSRSIDADGFSWNVYAQQKVDLVVDRAKTCLNDNNGSTTTTSLHPPRIYFASDTNDAVKYITTTTTTSSQKFDNNIVGMVTPMEKFHLDRNNKIGLIFRRKTPPSAFYPAIVDIWILSQAKCISIGTGGYGIFAAMLGGVGDCLSLYSNNPFINNNKKNNVKRCT